MASATTSATPLPSGYRAPLAVVTPTNHSAWPIICNAFGLTVILLCLGIRLYIRFKVSPPFGNDDHFLSAATLVAVVQCSIVFEQVHLGFGRTIYDISPSNVESIQKFAYASQLLYIVVLYLAKTSIIMLFQRISPNRSHKMTYWIVLAACTTLGVTSIFLVALRCDLSHPWLTYGQHCPSYIAQWSTVAAFDVITEIALFLLSVQLVWALQTSIKRKSQVILAFALRLPLIAIAIIRLVWVTRQIHSRDHTLVGAITSVMQQLEVFYAIMATTIPCLRPFLASFVTNFGAMGGDTVMNGSHIATSKEKGGAGLKTSKSSSFAMASLSSADREQRRGRGFFAKDKAPLQSRDRSNRALPDETFGLESATHHASISHGTGGLLAGDRSSMASAAESQRRLHIQKQVEWHVESDGDSSGAHSRSDASHAV